MKQLMFVLAICYLTVSVPTLSGDDPLPATVKREKVDPKKAKELMYRKLENAQKILEAIALNDLDKTAKHAQELIEISKALEWKVFKTRQYEMYSEDFRRSAETLVKLAKDKNLEGAKLTYLEMTLSCFHCHGYVRDVGMIHFQPDSGE